MIQETVQALPESNVLELVSIGMNALGLVVLMTIAYSAGRASKSIEFLDKLVEGLKTDIAEVRKSVGTRSSDRRGD
jgi:hypothetical protein